MGRQSVVWCGTQKGIKKLRTPITRLVPTVIKLILLIQVERLKGNAALGIAGGYPGLCSMKTSVQNVIGLTPVEGT